MISQESVTTAKVISAMVLEERIDLITSTLSRPYFNKILKRMTVRNRENAVIICDYIRAEEIEINIKDSTKECKIKVLS